MQLRWQQALGGLALLTMALPVWAKTDTIQYIATQPTMIEGHKLAAGTYTFNASNTTDKVVVQKDGTTVATVPCKWIQLPQKAKRSEVLSNRSKLTQLRFAGQTEAATFAR
ncbi:MAG TPA: hypothetical protein VJS43_04635 [Candidatus Acidoferrales bacterium]|nr:hypothetical protein [Candidatus Acidoferrales bacterium]